MKIKTYKPLLFDSNQLVSIMVKVNIALVSHYSGE